MHAGSKTVYGCQGSKKAIKSPGSITKSITAVRLHGLAGPSNGQITMETLLQGQSYCADPDTELFIRKY